MSICVVIRCGLCCFVDLLFFCFFFFFQAEDGIRDVAVTGVQTCAFRSFADGSAETFTYDAGGQQVARIDRDGRATRSEEHTSELQSRLHLVCRLLLEKKKTERILVPICCRSRPRALK